MKCTFIRSLKIFNVRKITMFIDCGKTTNPFKTI